MSRSEILGKWGEVSEAYPEKAHSWVDQRTADLLEIDLQDVVAAVLTICYGRNLK